MERSFTTQVRVRYAETDQAGIAHHSNHVTWLEVARVAWLREAGIPYGTLEQRGIQLTVAEVEIRYHRPVFFDDLLTIETTLEEAAGARMVLRYRVLGPQGDLRASGRTLLACIEKEGGRPRRLPAELAALIAEPERGDGAVDPEEVT